MPFERSCGTIVFHKDDKFLYLLLHYNPGHWDFPKGHVEKGEDDKQTARRELKEETGLRDIKFLDGFKEKLRYFYKKDGQIMSKEVTFFLVESKTNYVVLSEEHDDFLWLTYEEAVEKVTHKNAKELLKKANIFLTTRKTLSDF